QFCGVYTSLAADIKGHARLARGEIIIETFKAVKMTRWTKFMTSLKLDEKVDFEEGDIGLAGGIKTFEPALAHPVAKDQIVRFGGQTDGFLPWPEKMATETDNIERTKPGRFRSRCTRCWVVERRVDLVPSAPA
ncbi:unnamed protein product, partial [Durusdinium trenchii]